jgi:prophage antirepressor-like protein
MINNNGLFYVLSKSKKSLARLFMNKYIEEIMPEITSTGKYISSKDDIYKIKKLNNKILELQKENQLLIILSVNIFI